MNAKRELVARFRREYGSSPKAEKGRILDALCGSTGWSRKYAIEALRRLPSEPKRQSRRRSRKYGPNEEAALVKVWKLSGFLASKRLAPFMEEFLQSLERHEELSLGEPVRGRLSSMSASTMDRLLRRHRGFVRKGPSLTRPGHLLKKQIAVRRGTDWDENKPGFCEVDTLAHCGEHFEGEFFWSLGLTDAFTGWTEFAPLKAKGQIETLSQLGSIRRRLPFELLGLDSDNGGEFINYHLMKYCREQGILLTRGRPRTKNDQCRIEQKNGGIGRKHAGYGRYHTDVQFKLLSRLWGLLRLLVNFFEPSLKGKEKAMTPFRRLLASGALEAAKAQELEQTNLSLNPVKLREELTRVKMELYGLEAMVSFLDEASI